MVAYGLGDAGLSGRRAEESLALTRALGHAFGSAIALPGLARLARDRGDDRRATAAFQESLHLWASIGDQESIVQPLAGLAELASVHDQPETAATLVGAIDALAQEAGDFILERCMRFAGDNCDRAAARACAALGEGRFADLRAAGRALPLEEAIAVAATVTIPVRRTTPFPAASPLTAREHDVLRLVAAGQTDREIADALFLVSVQTARDPLVRVMDFGRCRGRFQGIRRAFRRVVRPRHRTRVGTVRAGATRYGHKENRPMMPRHHPLQTFCQVHHTL